MNLKISLMQSQPKNSVMPQSFIDSLLYLILFAISLLLTSHKTVASEVSIEHTFNQRVLIFGDSLSAAYNLPIEQGWAWLLGQELEQKKWNVSLTNASISGETSSGGLVRFQASIDRVKPHIVILELGANDGLRGFNLTTTRANLLKMIQISHKNNARVLLAGTHMPPNYGKTYTQKYDQIFTDLAKMENVSLLPFILEGVATHPELMQPDRLHPNQQGQKIMLSMVLQQLLPLLQQTQTESQITTNGIQPIKTGVE